jgi:hypothetical protein
MRDLEFERKFYSKLFAGAGLAFIIGMFSLFAGLELLLIDAFWPNEPGIFWTLQGIWIMVLSIVIASIFKSAQKQQG